MAIDAGVLAAAAPTMHIQYRTPDMSPQTLSMLDLSKTSYSASVSRVERRWPPASELVSDAESERIIERPGSDATEKGMRIMIADV